MIRSMTGFGSASLLAGNAQATVTIRSLNHRFLETSVRLPRRLAPFEAAVRSLVQQCVRRGRVDVALSASFEDEPVSVRVSRTTARAVTSALRALRAECALEGDVSLADIARVPGVIEVEESAEVVDDERWRPLAGLVRAALEDLDAMRSAEGRSLAGTVGDLLAAIAQAGVRIGQAAAADGETQRQALAGKVRAVCADVGLDDARLYQEVVRLVDRADVCEELARLDSHLDQARAALAAGGACGKRLDFLAQEMLREANTIGSKAVAAAIVADVVALKTDIERLREQVQNIE